MNDISIFGEQKFGFGCMRLPESNEIIDIEQFKKMVDYFLESGFTYFDTAHGYHSGRSETALKEALTSRYSHDRYTLTNKLTAPYFQKNEDIIPFFNSQLEACGVDYFDFYLMHAQSETNYAHFKKCRAYETIYELKKEGKIKHFGISFHDKASVLDMILNEHPEVEIVQIQFNYVDYFDAAVQSKLCYEICKKHNKPVIVMEPIKGGNLINLPPDALDLVRKRNIKPQELALRFVASFENIGMILSGMSNIEQVEDNTSFMKDVKKLDDEDYNLAIEVANVFRSKNMIPCTACRYCVDGCPKKISIPDLFALLNSKNVFHDWNADYYYNFVHTIKNGKASDCIKCGKCEKICPQHLPIRSLLVDVKNEFEK